MVCTSDEYLVPIISAIPFRQCWMLTTQVVQFQHLFFCLCPDGVEDCHEIAYFLQFPHSIRMRPDAVGIHLVLQTGILAHEEHLACRWVYRQEILLVRFRHDSRRPFAIIQPERCRVLYRHFKLEMPQIVYRNRECPFLVRQNIGSLTHGHFVPHVITEFLFYLSDDAWLRGRPYPSFDGHAVAHGIVVIGKGGGVFLRVVGQIPSINQTAIKLLVANGDTSLVILLWTETDVETVQTISRLNGVRSIALVLLCNAPHLAVVNHCVLCESYQPLARLVVAPISIRDTVTTASTEDKCHHR